MLWGGGPTYGVKSAKLYLATPGATVHGHYGCLKKVEAF